MDTEEHQKNASKHQVVGSTSTQIKFLNLSQVNHGIEQCQRPVQNGANDRAVFIHHGTKVIQQNYSTTAKFITRNLKM
jgi:hypothetical protein